MAVRYGNGKQEKNIDFFRNAINKAVSDHSRYISSRMGLEPDQTREFLQKPMQFKTLLYTIARNVFTIPPNESRAGKNENGIDFNNIDLLWELFIEYISLSNTFGQVGNIYNFCIMCNISFACLEMWENGTNRDTEKARVNYIYNYNNEKIIKSKYGINSHKDFIREVRKLLESNYLDIVLHNGSIGGIFALKSIYGYTEQDKNIQVNISQNTGATANEIEQRYKGASLPDKPSLDGIPTAKDADLCANDGQQDGSEQAGQQDPK